MSVNVCFSFRADCGELLWHSALAFPSAWSLHANDDRSLSLEPSFLSFCRWNHPGNPLSLSNQRHSQPDCDSEPTVNSSQLRLLGLGHLSHSLDYTELLRGLHLLAGGQKVFLPAITPFLIISAPGALPLTPEATLRSTALHTSFLLNPSFDTQGLSGVGN